MSASGFVAAAVAISVTVTDAVSTVDRGVYRGVAVSVEDSVPQKDCPLYLDNLEVRISTPIGNIPFLHDSVPSMQTLFSGASRRLFEVTGGQGWLGSVEVALPRGWDISLCQVTKEMGE